MHLNVAILQRYSIKNTKNYKNNNKSFLNVKNKIKISNDEMIFINQCYSNGNDDYNMNSITDNNNLENH